MDCIHLILEILTAVGTVGATVVALWLALRNSQPQINGVFVWSMATRYAPTLLVQNTGKKIVVIDSVKVLYNRHLVCNIRFSEEYSLKDFIIFEAGEVKSVPFNTDWLQIDAPANQTKPYKLKVVITPRSGRKGVSKQKYSYKELQSLFFGYGLFSNVK